MKVQDALKPTGKAIDKRNRDAYIEVRFECGANYLIWVNNKTGEYEGRLSYEAHFIEDWQPYHEEKEIRPEEPGETWEEKTRCLKYFTFSNAVLGLAVIDERGVIIDITENMVHGKNGFTRIEPPVEDDSIERINKP